jgi:hypothetical protein
VRNALEYVHVFLFVCHRCGGPLTASCVSNEKNLENADAELFCVQCHCGWTAGLVGITALKHSVEPWRMRSELSGLNLNTAQRGKQLFPERKFWNMGQSARFQHFS